jgi:HEAT repeat protein
MNRALARTVAQAALLSLCSGATVGAQTPARSTDPVAQARSLIAQLKDRRYPDSDAIVARLVKLGGNATPSLIEALQDRDLGEQEVDCRMVCDALGAIRDPRAVPRLLEVLDWKKGTFCAHYAIRALGQIGGPQTVERLIPELRHPDNVWPAAEALGQLGDPRAIEPLLAALDRDINESVTEALLRFGARAVTTARAALKSPDASLRKHSLRFLSVHRHIRTTAEAAPYLKDEAAGVRLEAVEALSRLPGASAGVVPLLLPAVSDADSAVRFAASAALFRRGDRRGVDTLVAELLARFPEENDKYDLVSLMGDVADRRLVAPLLEALTDSNDGVREQAARGLGRIRDPETIPALLEALSDWTTGHASAAALSAMKFQPRSAAERTHLLVARKDLAGLRNNWSMVREVLMSDMRSSDDPSAMQSAVFTIIALARTELVPDLIALLDGRNGVSIAEAYLNSGNKQLEAAARAWAEKRGYQIWTRSGGSNVRWGSF